MNKLLRFEFRRILLPLCVLTGIATLLFLALVFYTDYVGYTQRPLLGGGFGLAEGPKNSMVWFPCVALCLLCTLAPALQFSYRMNKRGTDLWFSLPVRREKLLFARALGGLALIFVPYTVSFWAGIAYIATQPNYFDFALYAELYALSLPLGVCFYGVQAFLFTRANRVGDGVVFMLGWLLLLALPLIYLQNHTTIYTEIGAENSLIYFTCGPLAITFEQFDKILLEIVYTLPDCVAIAYPLAAAEGIAAWCGLFLLERRRKAENAGQTSDSPFGYRLFVPAYTAAIAAADVLFILYVPAAVFGLVLLFVYRRSFRLHWQDLAVLAGALAVGIALGVVGNTLWARCG